MDGVKVFEILDYKCKLYRKDRSVLYEDPEKARPYWVLCMHPHLVFLEEVVSAA